MYVFCSGSRSRELTNIDVADGDVLATGCNSDGQLGLEDLQDRFAFVPVPLASSLGRSAGGVQKLLAGGDSSGLLAQSGELWTWGNSVRPGPALGPIALTQA